ncbi:BrnA antitoxin family protein [Rhodoplanes roseus]|uniref:3-oxoacyl-ACP synthase n=1 Tax=Rhodoplanes roseus TaxID=29409 RepID=A0A327L239_9BRAD|nr:BrnA antitoxin family protein [Rhodoplanes roseus]RAI44437.1 hypothetical protein CH341_09210 [Rhodoplanes roseus]
MSKLRTMTLSQLQEMKGQSDLEHIRRTTDAEIDDSIARDPDWAGLENIDWSVAELVVPPKKTAISIRMDDDVLDFFKAEGAGYQRRINAVLRSYMDQMKDAKGRKSGT